MYIMSTVKDHLGNLAVSGKEFSKCYKLTNINRIYRIKMIIWMYMTMT